MSLISRAKDDLLDAGSYEIHAMTSIDQSRQIAAKIGLTPRATRTRLAALVALGLVREIGTGPQDPKRRYFSTEAP